MQNTHRHRHTAAGPMGEQQMMYRPFGLLVQRTASALNVAMSHAGRARCANLLRCVSPHAGGFIFIIIITRTARTHVRACAHANPLFGTLDVRKYLNVDAPNFRGLLCACSTSGLFKLFTFACARARLAIYPIIWSIVNPSE